MQPNLGLSGEQLKRVVEQLNPLLADESVLYAKVRNYHWNVTGPQFITLHELFEEHYGKIQEIADDLAERARSLGGRAIGTMKEFLEHSQLKEQPGEYPAAQEMCKRLLADHETVIQRLRKAVAVCEEQDDEGTADMLTGFMEEHTKMAWMLRSLVEG